MTKLKSDVSAPWHMWVLGGLLLLWNGLATIDYVMTVIRYEPYLAGHSEDVLSYFYNAPLWMYVTWGISMIGGFIGTILLFMRRRLAVPVYTIAWLFSVVAVAYSFVKPVPGGSNAALFGIAVIIVSLLILIYFYWLQKRGVLR